MKKLSLWLTSLLFVATFLIGTPSKGFPQYNWILGGGGSASCIVNIPNDVTTGTVLDQYVKLTTAGAVVNASTSDTTRIVGVVVANAGTTGSASVQVCGIAPVNFDGSITAADFVIMSTSAGGKGSDSGSNSPSTSVQSVGTIVSKTTAGAGTYLVFLDNLYPLGGGGGGGGTVTSIGVTVPSILAVSPASITTSGTFAFSLTNQSANTFLGGPISGAATTSAFRLLGAYDVPGNVIAIANASSTGTTLNKIAKFTGAPVTAVIAGTGDITGLKGICIQGCGTTGTALIQQSGQSSCVFDGVTTANDFVVNSPTVAGDCHDAGSAYPTAAGELIGIVESTNGSGGTYTIDLFSPDVVGVSGGKPLQCNSFPTLTGDVSNTNCATTVIGVEGNPLAPHRVTTTTSTLAVNPATSLTQIITLHDTITLSFTAPPADGNWVRFKLTQSNGGSHMVTWPGSVEWSGATAPTLTTTNGQSDLVVCQYDGTTTNYLCTSALNFTP